LPVYPEFVPALLTTSGAVSEKIKAAIDSDGYARRPA